MINVPQEGLEILPEGEWFIALGKNFDSFAPKEEIHFQGTKKIGRLSPASKLIAQASAKILLKESESKVLFSTGNAGDTDHLTESESMMWYVHETYNIPMERMRVEPLSKDTKENAKNCSYMLQGQLKKPTRILSVRYHFPRALQDFQDAGFQNAHAVTAEDVLGGEDAYRNALKEHRKAVYYRVESLKEGVIRMLPDTIKERLRTIGIRLQGRR